MADHMLTTVDNPFNPQTDWDEWYAWDRRNGYNTPSLLARVTRSSNDLSPADQSLAIETAIDEIIEADVMNIYKKVKVSG